MLDEEKSQHTEDFHDLLTQSPSVAKSSFKNLQNNESAVTTYNRVAQRPLS